MRCEQTLKGFVYFPLSMDTSSDGRYILTGGKGFSAGNGADVKLWDRRSIDKPLHEMSGHSLDVKGVSFLPVCSGLNEGRLAIASALKDQSIRIWDQATGDQMAEWSAGGGMFTSMAALSHIDDSIGVNKSYGNMLLCAVTFWGSIYIYNTEGKCIKQHHVETNPALE